MSEEDLKKIEAYFDAELHFQASMGLAVTGTQETAQAAKQLIELHRRQTAEHQAILIWAKLVYRWLSTYFAVPPGFMRDVPPAIIRER